MQSLTYLERKLEDWQKRLFSLPEGSWDKKEAKEQVKALQRKIDAVIMAAGATFDLGHAQAGFPTL